MRWRTHGRLMLRFLRRVQKQVNHWWYMPMLAFLAALDIFILIIPADALLISAVLMKPKRWVSRFLWMSGGSAFGAWMLALGMEFFGTERAMRFVSGAINSDNWTKSAQFIHDHGALSVAFFAAGPFPLQPGVVVASLSGIASGEIFLWTWLGRALKYGVFAWAAVHAPRLFKRLHKDKDLIAAQAIREGAPARDGSP